MSETYFYLAVGAGGAMLIAFAVTLVLLLRAKGRPARLIEELAQVKSELERHKEMSLIKEKNLLMRMEDKDSECARVLKEKDVACARLVSAAERAKAEAVAAAQKMADEAIAACKASCDAAMKRKDDDVARLLKDRDEQQATVLREKNIEIERFLGEKERSFGEVVKTLQEQFANLAAQTLKVQSGDLTKVNSQQLEAVLKPLRDQLERLRSATEKTQTEHARLAEAIDKDVGRISDVAKELAGVS